MERKSGVLMHISSLYGDYSVGSFGDEAKHFVDFLEDCNFSYWQVLPFCMTDEYNSPYKSFSAFAGNPYFIDLNKLYEKQLVTKAELDENRQLGPYVCEFDRLKNMRMSLLFKAASRVENRREIEKFIQENSYLAKFCEFMALRKANNHKPWYEWKTEKIEDSVCFGWKFIQYEFFKQWEEIKKYANSKNIKIIGDIPIYVSHDSCDVWSNKNQYCLDSDGRPLLVAGVPPDYFCKDGQLWGNPIYNWAEMKKDGYKWWHDRISHMSGMFDALRIDHFRAIESYWAVPSGAESARSGDWLKGPGMELIDVIKDAAGKAMIIAEDLGDITPQVYELVKQSGFPGMRVFQFGFLSEWDSAHRPHNYPENCVAYTGTHDNNTLLGYLWELESNTRKFILSYCGHTGNWENGCESIIRTMMASHAGLVIIPIQDLLGHGSDTRMNTPGSWGANWQYRITRRQLESIDKNKLREMNRMYSR